MKTKWQLRESYFKRPGIHQFNGLDIDVDSNGRFDIEEPVPSGLPIFAKPVLVNDCP